MALSTNNMRKCMRANHRGGPPVRFHNQFFGRTADELWGRLHTTKRQRGKSVEEWGDRVTDLCDSLNYPNPQMRYQLFRRGLRNKRMLAVLDSSPARDISVACEWLMVKDLHRLAEEDEEFSDDVHEGGRNAQTASVDALAQQLQAFMQQLQQWQQQIMDNRWEQPVDQSSRLPTVSAVVNSPMNGYLSGNGGPRRGIQMAEDRRTQDGGPV
ncbi:hypothetical protein V7S43_012205 [Phytophthora oleae]|uniref:Uncharacterized protein n=1 Tax=Phytophthora oleae TaxID=2107226 RepID=A0ABD3F7U9_9STRA